MQRRGLPPAACSPPLPCKHHMMLPPASTPLARASRELSSGTGYGPSLRNVIQTDAAINPGNRCVCLLTPAACTAGRQRAPQEKTKEPTHTT